MTDATAVVLPAPGSPVRVQSFVVGEPEPGGVVIRVDYGGICGTDLHLQQGHLAIPTPLVLGHEGLGTVQALGDGLTRDAVGLPLRRGDRVMWASSRSCGECPACRVHREPSLCVRRRTCGVNVPAAGTSALSGSWAEYIALPAGYTVVRLPDAVDPVAAMAFACAGPTVVHALLDRRPVRVGESVLVQGSGPVGLAAAAVAQLSGAAEVTIVGGPPGRLRVAQECGIGDRHIDVVTDADPAAGLAAALAQTPGGDGADLVIECAGAPAAVAQGVRMVRRGGAYLVVGQYTDGGDTSFNPHQIVYRQLEIIGSWAFTGAHLIQYVGLLPALCARFDLARLVTVYPLAEAQEAMDAVRSGSVMKAILSPWPAAAGVAPAAG